MDTNIRLGVAVAVSLAMALWETLSPRRPSRQPRGERWPINLSLTILNATIAKLTVGGAVVGIAVLGRQQGWGLLNYFEMPDWLRVGATFLVLDFAIYLQHRVFHLLPMLWRLHSVHHSDLDYDWTTGARFHPLEILLSLAFKMACVASLGADPFGVFVFEIVLNASSTFQHSNLYLPAGVDKFIRAFMITPDMHTVHHSTIRSETDSNYGFFLTVWDRICRTYVPSPQKGFVNLDIGIKEIRDPKSVRFLNLLRMPFRS